MNEKTFPIRYFFSFQVPVEFLETVFSPTILLIGDRTNFVQEEPLDLQFFLMILAICVVEDVSIRLDILTLEF